MVDEPGTTPIQRVYAQRIAADLEHNRAEQQKVGEQLACLQARLEQLKADEEWLSGLQQGTAPVASTGSSPETDGTDEAAGSGSVPTEGEERGVPQQRQEGPADDERPAARKTVRKAAEKAGAKRTSIKKAAAKKTAKAASGRKAAGPSLRELARNYLEQQSEPRSVAEATEELRAAHPERTLSPQLVRNAFERLVATGAAERSKQGSSVYYTPVIQQAPAGASRVEEPQTADRSGQQEPEPAGAGA